MGWMYMIVCITDFVLFPVLWSMVQAIHGGNVTSQWNPITLAGAGLFHLAMGAVLGIAAFGRTQEKMAGANNNNLGFGASPGGYGASPGGYGAAPVSNSYGSTPMGGNSMSTYGSPAPSYNTTPGSFGGISAGKARPAEPQYPVL